MTGLHLTAEEQKMLVGERGAPVIEVLPEGVASLRRWREVRVVADGTGAAIAPMP